MFGSFNLTQSWKPKLVTVDGRLAGTDSRLLLVIEISHSPNAVSAVTPSPLITKPLPIGLVGITDTLNGPAVVYVLESELIDVRRSNVPSPQST